MCKIAFKGDLNMNYSNLLKEKGFVLNTYPEGKFWELVITNDESKKEHICKVFGADIELFDSDTTYIDTLILQKILQNVSFIMTVIHLIWKLKHL